ncbi:MAG: hypothetical protein QOF06_1172 [Solirubrobacterales bacterium]|nr:hypothetical protein [Solirubrobacterales bacterium]
MSVAASSAVTDVAAKKGELAFSARVEDREQRLWFRTETAVRPPADPVLPAILMPAMTRGGRLEVDAPLSARLLRNQPDFQALQRFWSSQWPFGLPPLREVEVAARARVAEGPERPGRVATFFSGGVDSWATVLGNPDVTDLIFARGIDLVPGWPQHEALADEVEARLCEAAAELNLPLHVLDTNLRTLSDPLLRWETFAASALAAIALFFQPLFERVLIATDIDFQRQVPLGAAQLVDHLWSTEGLDVVDWGSRFGRTERLRQIVDHPVVQRTLRVCWLNPNGAYNCGRCGKCLLTMIALEAIGAREEVRTFPSELDLRLLGDSPITVPLQLTFWEELLETTQRAGRSDLERPVAAHVEAGRHAVGGPDYELQTVLGSRSWRLTAPLRRFAERTRRG